MVDVRRLNLNLRIRQSAKVLCNTLDSETVFLNVETGFYFSTNAIGSDLWNYFSDQPSLAAVVKQFQKDRPAEAEEITEDIYNFINELLEAKLVEILD